MPLCTQKSEITGLQGSSSCHSIPPYQLSSCFSVICFPWSQEAPFQEIFAHAFISFILTFPIVCGLPLSLSSQTAVKYVILSKQEILFTPTKPNGNITLHCLLMFLLQKVGAISFHHKRAHNLHMFPMSNVL